MDQLGIQEEYCGESFSLAYHMRFRRKQSISGNTGTA